MSKEAENYLVDKENKIMDEINKIELKLILNNYNFLHYSNKY